ncbi:hypothetical protein DL546_002184 [Coniochaeta pulveracea]|uniref:AB hydrolase-1 domain-containing protein n=1 Tax=Coniochaeta pulveracea TaxID=177199 RepID=A0A420YLJ3_9PEZI|nr:hypothetical protein DL546_002184 [Coniochaeta pulveracea]
MSSPSSNVHFLLVPGSFSTPPPYNALVTALTQAGFSASVIPLLSANDGTHLPPATMEEDAASIRAAILSILDHPTSPRNVVVVPHSYGGFPASEACLGLTPSARAASGKTTSVIGLVYIGSFLPVEGECLRDIMSRSETFPPDLQIGNPGGYLPPIPAEFASVILNDVKDPVEAARLHATMTLHSSDSYNGKVGYAPWKEVKTVVVTPGEDLVIPVEMQEEMYERAKAATGGKVKKWVVEGAGHCAAWTRPEDFARATISVLQD